MSYTLIIVESPHKSETIGHILKNGYKIIGSKGHIRTLPDFTYGYKIIDNQVIPSYTIDKTKKKLINEMKELISKASNIILATDDDREGESIAWHLLEVLKLDINTTNRAVFHEITQQGIITGLNNLRKVDMNLVNAQQARRILDRMVGYKLSPLLSKKIESRLSAGRVQSPTLKIIVDREREIKSFIPIPYFDILCKALNQDAKLVSYSGKVFKDETELKDEMDAKWIVKITLDNKDNFKVTDVSTKITHTKPTPPFTTSTMQQYMNSNYGWSPTKTSSVAQRLYEGIDVFGKKQGLVTYIRTDSVTVSTEAIVAVRQHILNTYGEKYLPSTYNVYKNKSKNAQEAHEAIRPTNMEYTPDKLKGFIDIDEHKLYNAIYSKFVSSQMTNAEYRNKTITISVPEVTYKIFGKVTLFDGYTKVLKKKDTDIELPDINIGDIVKIDECSYAAKETLPPHRYTQAGVIKIMEDIGIGRPSTYSATMKGLIDKKYVEVVKGSLIPTEAGFKIVEFLEQHFPNIIDTSFTANMEEQLDIVAAGNEDWNKFVLDFYIPFDIMVKEKLETIPDKSPGELLDEKCPKCNSNLIMRKGRFNSFKGCSSFPKCKYFEKSNLPKAEPVITGKCDKCGGNMVEKLSKWKTKFIACDNYPNCKNILKNTKKENDGK